MKRERGGGGGARPRPAGTQGLGFRPQHREGPQRAPWISEAAARCGPGCRSGARSGCRGDIAAVRRRRERQAAAARPASAARRPARRRRRTCGRLHSHCHGGSDHRETGLSRGCDRPSLLTHGRQSPWPERERPTRTRRRRRRRRFGPSDRDGPTRNTTGRRAVAPSRRTGAGGYGDPTAGAR